MQKEKIKYSIFTPAYNEEGNIIPLFEEVKEVMNEIGEPWEFIFVNDGSTDDTLREILSIKDDHVRVLPHKANYGQSVAMDTGFRACRGEFVISMDADLQNDPKDIPRLIEKMNKEHFDVVAGWRHKRKDPAWMLVVTRSARFLRNMFVNDSVHDSGCTLRIYRRHFVDDLELTGEMHRYIVALLKLKGARIGELKVNHRERTQGVSKYNFTKSFRGLVDLFYIWFWKKYASRPLHLFGVGGMALSGLGLLSGVWTAYLKIFNGVSLSDSAWFMLSFFLVVVGLQLFLTGIMLDLQIKNYYNSSRENRYRVREIVKERKR